MGSCATKRGGPLCYNRGMNKKYILGGVGVIIIIVLILVLKNGGNGGDGFKSATYRIEGEDVLLVNGSAEGFKYSEPKAKTDFNNDGKADVVFLIEKTSGISTYYLVAALKNDEGYWGTNGVLLGESAPEKIEFLDGKILAGGKTIEFVEGTLLEVKK